MEYISCDPEEFSIGDQCLSNSGVLSLDLDDLHTIYEAEVMQIDDVRQLSQVKEDMLNVLAYNLHEAINTLDDHDVDVGWWKVEYKPGLEGAKRVDDRVIGVGQPGKLDRPYYLQTELTHELLHEYFRAEGIVDEYTAAEEGLLQVWNLYMDDVIDAEPEELHKYRDAVPPDAAEERLDDVRQTYNEHITDGFGDDIHTYATRLLGMYQEESGTPRERMTTVLTFAQEHVL